MVEHLQFTYSISQLRKEPKRIKQQPYNQHKQKIVDSKNENLFNVPRILNSFQLCKSIPNSYNKCNDYYNFISPLVLTYVAFAHFHPNKMKIRLFRVYEIFSGAAALLFSC